MSTIRFFNTTGPCNPDEHYMLSLHERLQDAHVHRYIRNKLNRSILIAPKPLIVLFDEVDVLQEETMISFLQQMHNGFTDRGIGKFPVTIAVVGMRDLKDYINEQSRRQPWIVNSLFKRATLQILEEESAETVTLDHILEAREKMIMARETHLDALAYRLKEPGVRSVIEPILTGESDPDLAEGEAFRVCLDLGLVALEDDTPAIANPIYREIIARHLTYGQQLAITKPEWQWEKPDGSLDMDRILKEFQLFWRENSELWESKSTSGYTEAFPHLLLMAFLQRVLNGGGNIERECAAGRGRMDLRIDFNKFRYIIEIKLLRSYHAPAPFRQKGLIQIRQYRNRFGEQTPAYLIIFDRRPESGSKSWDERITWEIDGDVAVLGC